MFSRTELVSLYRRRAARYDFTANLYYLVGFREWRYRERGVESLHLQQGDTVVEIGCGTGLNFTTRWSPKQQPPLRLHLPAPPRPAFPIALMRDAS